MPYLADVLGTAAALCSMASFVPQILKIDQDTSKSKFLVCFLDLKFAPACDPMFRRTSDPAH
jgi:hypothetical protein